MVAPTKPKKVAAKGKEVTCPVTQLQACKVTHVTSPLPEVAVPAPLVASPSRVTCPPLFEKTTLSGEKDIGSRGKGVPKTLGE